MGVIGRILDDNRRYGWRYTLRRIYRRFGLKYIWGRRNYPCFLPETECQGQREEALAFSDPPLISIVVPLFHTPEKYFREMLESVFNQTYPYWELCLADASEDNHLGEIVEQYKKKAGRQIVLNERQEKGRIQYLHLGKNGGIAENSNAAARMAGGEYIALLDHDDLLHPAALYEIAKVICEQGVSFIYTDELSFVKSPSVVQSVHLKSDFRWEHIRSNNYICHFSVFSRALFWKVGGFRQEYDGAQDYDLFLRMAEVCNKIQHIPQVLYYWRIHEDSSAAGMAAKPYVAAAGRKALEDHLKRIGLLAQVDETEFGTFYRVNYRVPEGSRVLLLAEDEDTAGWLRGDLAGCPYTVDIQCGKMENTESGGHSLNRRTGLQADGQGMGEGETEPYQKAVNSAYGTDADYVVIVRSGYRPVNRGHAWLSELLGGLQWREHSLAGALIYNKEGKVEHAGFYHDLLNPGKVYPRYRGVPKAENGYMNHLCFTRVVDYLYGAVIAMGWKDFRQEFPRQKGGEWGKMFVREAWFSLCSKFREKGKYSVLTVQEPWIEKK